MHGKRVYAKQAQSRKTGKKESEIPRPFLAGPDWMSFIHSAAAAAYCTIPPPTNHFLCASLLPAFLPNWRILFFPFVVIIFFSSSSFDHQQIPPPPPTYTPTRQSAISLFVKYTLVESNRSVGYKKSMNTFIGFPLLVLLLLASLLAWFVGRYHFLAKTPSSCSWPSFPSSLLLVEGRPTLQASSSLGPQMLCG